MTMIFASFFSQYFADFISNGVYPNPSTMCQIIANYNMTVTEKAGNAYINGQKYKNDGNMILTIEIADGAFMMIHKATSGGWGTDNELRKVADVLTMVEKSIVDVYTATTKKTPEQIQQWMEAETWFTADEAVANGFAHRVTSRLVDAPTNLANISWNLSAYNNAPKALLEPPKPKEPELDVASILENNQRRLRLLVINV